MQDIIKDVKLPLLKIIPSSGPVNFDMETFCNVQPDSINKIRIWMTESLMGKPVQFHGDVIMKLVFEHI